MVPQQPFRTEAPGSDSPLFLRTGIDLALVCLLRLCVYVFVSSLVTENGQRVNEITEKQNKILTRGSYDRQEQYNRQATSQYV